MSEKIKELEEMVEIVSIAIGRERGFIRYFEEAYKKTTHVNLSVDYSSYTY
jgi:hypothetical protein